MIIREIKLGTGVEFIIENETKEDKLSNNFRGNYVGCFEGKRLVGVLLYVDTKSTRRIRMLVTQNDAKNDIAKFLLKWAIQTDMNITAFVVPKWKDIFKCSGFRTKNTNRFDIDFMEVEADEKPSV